MPQTLAAGLQLHEFAPVSLLAPGGTVCCTLGVDFRDSTHAARFELVTSGGRAASVSLAAPMGETLRPVTMEPQLFLSRRGQSADLRRRAILPLQTCSLFTHCLDHTRTYWRGLTASAVSKCLQMIKQLFQSCVPMFKKVL